MANALSSDSRPTAESFSPREIEIFRDIGSLADTANDFRLAVQEVPWILERLTLSHDGAGGTTPVYTFEVLKVPSGITTAAAVAAPATYRIATAMAVSSTGVESHKQWTWTQDPAARQFAAGDKLVISQTRTGTTPTLAKVQITGLGRTWIP